MDKDHCFHWHACVSLNSVPAAAAGAQTQEDHVSSRGQYISMYVKKQATVAAHDMAVL